jgi:hypothetical protein
MYYKLDCPRVCFDVFEGVPCPPYIVREAGLQI